MRSWAACLTLPLLLSAAPAMAGDEIRRLNEQLIENQARFDEDRAFAFSVEEMSFGLTNDLCYFYQFRQEQGLPLRPTSPYEARHELITIAKNWSPQLKNSYAAHLFIAGKGVMNFMGINSSDQTAASDFMILFTPSRFTEYLISARGFKKAFRGSACANLFSFDQFQDLILREDIASRALTELAVTGGTVKLASVTYRLAAMTSWGAAAARFLGATFTAKRLTVAGAIATVGTGGLLAHDILQLRNHEAAATITPEFPSLEDDGDFLHVMADDFYHQYRTYLNQAQAEPEKQLRLRAELATWKDAFMKDHGPLAQARFEKISLRFAAMPDFSKRALELKARKARGDQLSIEEQKFLHDVAFAAKLELLLEFSS